MSGYNTNLAAEYHVLACLHRLGATASLTLGNKKGVDILVARAAGDSVTVEVKGVTKRYDWDATNIQSPHPERHYVILVAFGTRSVMFRCRHQKSGSFPTRTYLHS